jgi:small-conductance mechanosensitive channel
MRIQHLAETSRNWSTIMPTLTNTPEILFLTWLPHLAFALGGLLAHALTLRAVRRVLRVSGSSFWGEALKPLCAPTRLATLLLALQLARVAWPLPEAMQPLTHKLIALGWITALAWLTIALGGILGQWMQRNRDITSADNLQARKTLTKIRMFRRIFTLFALVLALAAALMVFDATRGIGASVLASAGIAGAIAGLSAQKFLGAVLAGVQIAIAQPIRLDDVVVVEGEWGRVEEIGITYVVVRIWDERRLILPTTYFLERPIQNWTRTSANILGSAFVIMDYRAPIPALRAELERICREEAGELWDGRVCTLQVTEAGPTALTLRALVSSSNSSRNWDLRCLVRERLICYVQGNHPETLPRTRVLLAQPGQTPPEAGPT